MSGRAALDVCQQVAVDGRALDEDCQRPGCDNRVYRLNDHDRCLAGHKQRDHPTHQ